VRILQGLVGAFGIFAAMLVLVGAEPPGAVPLLLLWFLLVLAGVALHELGHLTGAAFAGAHILGASIGPLYFERRRRGVRIQWRRSPRGLAGMAFAVPDTSKPIRRQMLAYVAAGPLANVLAAAICVTLVWGIPYQAQTWGQAAYLAFGLLNAAMAVANLLPVRNAHASDGWQLARWWRSGEDVQKAERVLYAMNQSLRGVIASEFPSEQLAWFESNTEIGMRFWGRYIALRAAQQRGDDRAFAGMLERCEQELADADRATHDALRELWAYFQIEQAFEHACGADIGAPQIDPLLLGKMQPYFRHRLAAAQARARGDEATCRREIAKALRDVDGVYDAATRRAEPVLLERVRMSPPASAVPA
jgi:hypothetical protein